MKKKIYDKKSFYSEIFFMIFSLLNLFLLIMNFVNNKDSISIKDLIILIVLFAISFFEINQSLDYKLTQEKKKENDEREEFINLKASSSALNILSILSFLLMLLNVFLWHKTKLEGLLGAVLACGIFFNLSLLVPIFTYFYYNKKL